MPVQFHGITKSVAINHFMANSEINNAIVLEVNCVEKCSLRPVFAKEIGPSAQFKFDCI